MKSKELNCEGHYENGRTILLSLKPKFAEAIFSGKKNIEFRRVWTKFAVQTAVIYITSPVQRFAGLVDIEEVRKLGTEELWGLSQHFGGGVLYEELSAYLHGKDLAYGIILNNIRRADFEVDPHTLFSKFTAPQSYRFLSSEDSELIFRKMFLSAR